MKTKPNIETKIRQLRIGYKFFDYAMAFCAFLALMSLWRLATYAGDVQQHDGLPLAVIAFTRDVFWLVGCWVIRNLFRHTIDVVDELRSTI